MDTDSKNRPILNGLLGFNKGAKVILYEKVFSTNIEMEHLDVQIRKIDLVFYFTSYTKRNWGLNIDLTIIYKTIKPLEENISGYLCDTEIDKGFLGRTQKN